ncbi:protein FAR1-RELATED SEQUENCE 5-like [Silene latifolia]|uniref:protein FAR1-RELATED SEQUENCE 5-like n=1 Tax=Silene latifolia TaxID=37657 RepID=UPI003D76F62F
MGDGSSTNSSTITRRVKITRIGCRAYVGFALLHGLDGPAMIDEFSEVHNHRLTSVCNRDLDKISRSLDMFQKTLILDNSKLNIGAGLTFRQVKELVNGYENIGATLIDFKNFQRDIKCYIGLRDADLFIDRLEKLKATQPQFYFAYDVDPQNRLTKFFWADATYLLKIIVPQLSDSNYHCSMSSSFTRLFNNNVTAFPSVFKTARHRYCMWHITQKITDKVGSRSAETRTSLLASTPLFGTRYGAVGVRIEVAKVISDFELEDNDWLTTMFDDRHP